MLECLVVNEWEMFIKKFSFIFTIFIYVGLLTACNDEVPKIEIEIEATISPVSEEEYQNISVNENVSEPKQEDFKFFEFNFDMEHIDSVKKRDIEMYKFDNLQ